MSVCKIVNGVVVERWDDVDDLTEFTERYTLSGPQYVLAAVSPGTLFDGVAFTAPAVSVPVPQSISKLQAKLTVGAAVVAQIDAFMNDISAPWAMRTAWADASELHRNSQMVQELAWVLGWNETQLDTLFINGANVQV